MFTDAYAGEVGSLHDYTLYRRSSIYTMFQNGQAEFYNDHYMIGDLAYKLSTNLIVGFKDNGHLTDQQKLFNRTLSKLRVKIENAFALLKGRFRRLKFVETIRLDLIVLIIISACILHNVCILNDDMPHEIVHVPQELAEVAAENHNIFPDIDDGNIQNAAIIKRNDILNAL